MTQYCRYCAHFVTGNGNYCEEKKVERTDKQAKSPNRCKAFDFNEIDAFFENEKGYKPRVRERTQDDQKQITLFDAKGAQ